MYKLDIDEWGKSGWNFLTAIGFRFPLDANEEEKAIYRAFFENAGNVLPCGVCAEHFAEYLAQNPVEVNYGPRGLVSWILDLHNEVNRENGKEEWLFLRVVADYMPADVTGQALELDEDETKIVADYQKETQTQTQTQKKKEEVCPGKSSSPKLPLMWSAIAILSLISIICIILLIFKKKR